MEGAGVGARCSGLVGGGAEGNVLLRYLARGRRSWRADMGYESFDGRTGTTEEAEKTITVFLETGPTGDSGGTKRVKEEET